MSGDQSIIDIAAEDQPLLPSLQQPQHWVTSPCSIHPLFALLVFLDLACCVTLLYRNSVLVFVSFIVLTWIITLSLHEFSHAVVAYYGGDYTVYHRGYLDLNPLGYTDICASIIVPTVVLLLGGIGFPGGAVHIDGFKLRSRVWATLVALAGPICNLLCALLLALPFAFNGFIQASMPPTGITGSTAVYQFGLLHQALAFSVFMQNMAFIINLLPLPSLDGFNALLPWLPRNAQVAIKRSTVYAVLCFFTMMTVIALIFLVPQVFIPAHWLTLLIGVPHRAVAEGLYTFLVVPW
jgi:Zn-dependent protease